MRAYEFLSVSRWGTVTGGGASCFRTRKKKSTGIPVEFLFDSSSHVFGGGVQRLHVRQSMPPPFAMSGEGVYKNLQENVARGFFRKVERGSTGIPVEPQFETPFHDFPEGIQRQNDCLNLHTSAVGGVRQDYFKKLRHEAPFDTKFATMLVKNVACSLSFKRTPRPEVFPTSSQGVRVLKKMSQ